MGVWNCPDCDYKNSDFVGLYIIDKAKIHILADFVVKRY